jgi:lysophospholipase L1-like esterase
MRYSLATIALGPVLLAQGIATRRRVPKLPEPPGLREGVRGDGQALKLLIVGDSAAAGVGASHQDEALLGQVVSALTPDFRVAWSLHAQTGNTTSATLAYLDALRPRRFDVAVTSLGVNDVTRFVGRNAWRSQQARLRALLRQKFGVSKLLISGLPPMHGFPALPQPLRWHIGGRATQFNRDLENDVAADDGAHFVDLRFTTDLSLIASDGFHPGPGMYAEWGKRVAELIRQ